MYVQEYFKHVIENKDIVFSKNQKEKHKELLEHFGQVYQKFVSDFNRTRKILSDYTNVVLKEYNFVKDFLNGVDEEDFFTDVIDDIVENGLYKSEMLHVLASKHYEIFNETLHSDDTEYIFLKVFDRKLSLYDEQIITMLEGAKLEYNLIIEHIHQQFNQVLQRVPDTFEEREHIKRYRSVLDTKVPNRQFDTIDMQTLDQHLDSIDDKTEKLLIGCLEFHDIIKENVRKIYPSITPRNLFQVLQEITRVMRDLDLDGINAKISEFTLKMKECNHEI